MSDTARDYLTRGILAAKAKQAREARRYLQRALDSDPDPRQRVDATFWLSEVCEGPGEKRGYLEETLAYEPTHFLARRNLAILDGHLDPGDALGPGEPPGGNAAQAAATSRRYVCPRCGGRMAYDPDAARLKCRYCGVEQTLLQALDRGLAVREEDFILALATAKGQASPLPMPSFECEACGGVYVLSPLTLSLTCPYCGAVYVVEHAESRSVVVPEGVIPFTLSEADAAAALGKWRREEPVAPAARMSSPRGGYLPAWTFDIAGEVPWAGWKTQGRERVPASGTTLSLHNDLLVPATHRLAARLAAALDGFDLQAMVPYDPAYLAEWPAELYQIPPVDAAMAARWKALSLAERQVHAQTFGEVEDLHLSATRLLIEAYRLVLLPVWLATFELEALRYNVLVNGQTGRVDSERPLYRRWEFLKRFFGLGA